jgi:hypothetical protein
MLTHLPRLDEIGALHAFATAVNRGRPTRVCWGPLGPAHRPPERDLPPLASAAASEDEHG